MNEFMEKILNDAGSITPADTWKIFDQISSKYDLLNSILSFGTHNLWRKRMCDYLPLKDDLKVLDLATGTADVILAFLESKASISSAYGIDLSEKMLLKGKEKVVKKGLAHRIKLSKGDAQNIPFDTDTFDLTSMAFGIRNAENPSLVLEEMRRVLKKNGRALILEFSLPKNKIFRSIHLFYLRNVVPAIGHIFSGHYNAYKYLSKSIEAFPYGEEFCALMRGASFKNVKYYPLSCGIATIYQGDAD